MGNYILEMNNISKEFSGVKALDDVTFKVKKGEIHALCGENGAGKSTLMKILSGVWAHGTYTGDVFVQGKECKFHDLRAPEKAGIAIIYQELALVDEMDVGENIFLNDWKMNKGLIDFPSIYSHTQQLCAELKLDVNPAVKVRNFGVGVNQLVEIAKALNKNAEILILDEPTAALTESEVDILMDLLNDLRDKGVTCIYISHKLNEILRISDNCTVLRDGKLVGTYPTAEIDEAFIVKQMVGREITDRFPYVPRERREEVAFEVKDYNVSDTKSGKKILEDINFQVRNGEILGISGLMGSGRTELALSLFGFMKAPKTGKVFINGKEVHIKAPTDAIELGMGMVSEDRKHLGLFLDHSIVDNIVTTSASLKRISKRGMLNLSEQVFYAKKFEKELDIRTSALSNKARSLSGGNQQKVVLAKWLMTEPDILFLDEPTRGIDVGAKYEIYNIMLALANRGVAVIMISSELPEVLGMSDRILVMHEGTITGELMRDEATQEKVMHLATGGKG